MSKYIDKAMAMREPTPRPNCAETVLLTFAEECGISEETAHLLGANFGHGMKTGATCGAVTGALMVLGMLGVTEAPDAQAFQRRMQEKHMTLGCSELLRGCAERGEVRLTFCNGLIRDAITLIEEMAAEKLK